MLSSLPVARVCPSGANATDDTAPVWPVSGSPEPAAAGSGPRRPTACTVWSALPVARVCPSGANATAYTASVWPVSGSPSRRGRAGSVTSHSITVLSSLAVARVRPSGANATDVTRVGVAGQRVAEPAGAGPGRTSHSSTVLSALPVARVCPSGANATEDTVPVWPVSVPEYRVLVRSVDQAASVSGRVEVVGGLGEPERGPWVAAESGARAG